MCVRKCFLKMHLYNEKKNQAKKKKKEKEIILLHIETSIKYYPERPGLISL